MKDGKYLEANKELLGIYLPLDLNIRKLLIPFLFAMTVVSIFYDIPFPLPPLAVLFVIYFVTTEMGLSFIKKGYGPATVIYFFILIKDCVLVSFAAYYTGGIESFMPIVYIVIGVLGGLTLPLWGVLGIIISAGISYFIELYLEAYGIIPHIGVFKEFFQPQFYLQSGYYRFVPLAYFTIFIAITFVAYTVSDMLREKIREMEELKANLEDKIGERTKELGTAKSGLEKEVAKRTAELEEAKVDLEKKVTERTADLEQSRKAILHMMKDLKEDMARLQVVDKMKTEFLSMVSHELRTPMTPIRGYLALLSSGKRGALTPGQKDAVEVLGKQSEHLLSIIDSLLDLSRIELGKPILISKSPVSVKNVIEETVEAMQIQAQEQEHKIIIEEQADLPTIMADIIKLRRILINLIGNAVKFTPRSGEIRIRAFPEGANVRIEVVDNGIGIARENLEKIFEKFYQVDASSTRAAGGMGMGLPIARELVELHGGKLWAESDGPGSGSRFILTLPVV